MGYVRSPFGDFETYLRNVVGSDEDDIHKFFKTIHFMFHEIPPENYSI